MLTSCSAQEEKPNKDIVPEHLTTKTFKEKIFNYEKNREWKFEGKLPAIIDFYADWCAPCKRVAPVMEELAVEYEGEVNIYKVDTASERELASVFRIQSIPSILFIPIEGQPTMAKGALPKDTFVKFINEHLLENDLKVKSEKTENNTNE
ncbi:MAG: thioredoxin domain-containing protein [Candidatus Cloacimonadota bacterium]|nr:thioredoxin domain-containing protein [Candidatus Cloacimonadota bacterium]